MESFGRYYSPQGDQLGIGPLPPVVDVQTNYWIFWKVESSSGNFSDFLMSAKLPENIVFTGNKTVLFGDLHYGEESRRVIWSLESVRGDGGPYVAGFEVGLIPSSDNVGKDVVLLEKIGYTALSSINGNSIEKYLKNIDTSIPFDSLASEKGKVILSQ